MLNCEMEEIWQCRFPKRSRQGYVWPRETTTWWFETLGFNLIIINEKVCTFRSARFQWRCVSKNFWRQHKQENRILQRWRWNSRAFQGHSGGIPVEPEWMGYVFIPRNWKEYVFIEDIHGTSSPYWEVDWFREERRKIKPVRESF